MGLALNVQVYQGGQFLGQHQFDSDTSRTIKIGRLSSAQLKLEDPKVSRIHAVIEFAGAAASLVDMGSTVGTSVNGSKVHKVKLNHGDQIAVGDTTLIVGVGAAAPGLASAAPAAAPAAGLAAMPQTAPGAMPGFAPQTMPVAAGAQAAWPQAGGAPAMAARAAPMAAPAAYAQGMPGAAPMQRAAVAPAAVPVQPSFDGGPQGGEIRRITQERLRVAAVESKPHPALPPEPELSKNNRVLEMRVYWGEVLLAMHHYVEPKRITIGEHKNTDFFISSEGLPVESFPLIRFMDGEYVLSFCSEMEGEVEVGGQVHSLAQARGSSLVKQDADYELTYRINMPTDTRALIHWGGVTFALRFVPPTKAVTNEFFRNMDFQYVNVLLLSVFLHVALFVTLMVYPYDTESLREDLFNEPDRFASLILNKPKATQSNKNLLAKIKKKVEEKKKQLEKQVPKTKQPILRISHHYVRPQKTRAQKQAEVKQKFSKLFSGSGSGGGSILGGGGGGSLSGTLSNVIGTAGKGSATAGLAGLGIRGSGPLTGGGVGTSRGIAGIGTAGRLGGGGLAYGSGVGLGRRKHMGISLATPVVMGALPKEVIQRVINENKAQVRYCYEIELQRHPNLEGRVSVKWIIAATGSVAKVQIKDSTLHDSNVERCIAAKIKGWRFPPPAGGGIVEVNYPFVLRAS